MCENVTLLLLNPSQKWSVINRQRKTVRFSLCWQSWEHLSRAHHEISPGIMVNLKTLISHEHVETWHFTDAFQCNLQLAIMIYVLTWLKYTSVISNQPAGSMSFSFLWEMSIIVSYKICIKGWQDSSGNKCLLHEYEDKSSNAQTNIKVGLMWQPPVIPAQRWQRQDLQDNS